MSSSKRSYIKDLIVKEAEREIRKRNFWEFCLHYDPEFFTRRSVLQQAADGLQAIHEDKIQSLSISMPPRSGKSYLISLFIAWSLGNHPQDSIMRNTCTATLYDKFSYDVRAIITSEQYRETFPTVQLAADKKNLDGWSLSTSRQTAYFGAGVGGTIIGFGASLYAITDDLYKSMKDALSPGTNRTVHQWKESAHDSRLEKNCKKIDIGTRWTKQDVIGKNIEEGEYDLSIVLPALVKDPETGEERSFCEDVMSTAQYKKIRRKIAKGIWNAEYQQEPVEQEGLLFTKKDLKRFKLADINKENAVAILGYIDPSDEGTDFFCFPLGYIFPNKIYITDVIFTRDNINLTLPRSIAMIKDQEIYKEKPEGGEPELVKEVDRVRLESNGMGSPILKMFRNHIPAHKILPVGNSGNKHARILLAMAFIIEHCYFRDESDYEEDSEYDQYVTNLLDYRKDGTSENDDAPDGTQGLAKFAQGYLKHLFKA